MLHRGSLTNSEEEKETNERRADLFVFKFFSFLLVFLSICLSCFFFLRVCERLHVSLYFWQVSVSFHSFSLFFFLSLCFCLPCLRFCGCAVRDASKNSISCFPSTLILLFSSSSFVLFLHILLLSLTVMHTFFRFFLSQSLNLSLSLSSSSSLHLSISPPFHPSISHTEMILKASPLCFTVRCSSAALYLAFSPSTAVH